MSAEPPREVRARSRNGSNSDGQLLGHVPRSTTATTAYAEHAAERARAVRTASVLFIGMPPSTATSEADGTGISRRFVGPPPSSPTLRDLPLGPLKKNDRTSRFLGHRLCLATERPSSKD